MIRLWWPPPPHAAAASASAANPAVKPSSSVSFLFIVASPGARPALPAPARALPHGIATAHIPRTEHFPNNGAALANAPTTIDGQRHPGDEPRLVGVEEQSGIGDIPPGPHLAAERHAAVPLSDDLFAWHARGNAGSIAMGVFIRPGKITFARMP